MIAYAGADAAVFRSVHQVRIDKLAEVRRARGELNVEDGGLDFGTSDEDAFDEVDSDFDDEEEENWTVEGEDELEIGDFYGDGDEDDDDEDEQGDGASMRWDDDEDADSLFQYIK